MRLFERFRGALGTVRERLSRAQARLRFPRFGTPRNRLIVSGIAVLVVILGAVGAWAIFEATMDSDDGLSSGDLKGIIASTGRGEATPATTVIPLPEVAAPARMVIDKMGVDAPIITLGLDANRLPEVPNGPDTVAWYDFSAKPGQGSNAVFSGHVDWTVNGQPVTAVFWRLGELEEGDVVRLTLEDGSELLYRVTNNVTIRYDDPDGVKVMDETPNDVITLISCGGTWVPDPSSPLGGNYTQRVIVRAERVP